MTVTPTPRPPATPGANRRYLAALYAARGPMRPIDIYENATGETVPPAQRGSKGSSVARELRDLIRLGEVYAVYRDDRTDRPVRYALTAAGRLAGKAEHDVRPVPGKGTRP